MILQLTKHLTLLAFILAFPIAGLDTHSTISRSYCTEIGKFNMLFDEDEVSGSYSLSVKNSLGAVWGKLEGNKMTGRWFDADGGGEIIITFNEDFSWFTTKYRNDEKPETWYTDQWHGALRTGDESTFQKDGKTYRCE